MKQPVLIGLVLALGIISGTSISPLLAQSQTQTQRADSQQMTCYVGEGSNAACNGKWIYFAGNTGNLDESAWFVRVNSDTGEIWYKNGKKLQLLVDVK